MAATDVAIVNDALTLLGEARITTLADDVKPAREANAIYTDVRDALLSRWNWKFAKTYIEVISTAPPDTRFANAYALPGDCLRVVMVNEEYAGLDLSNYRGVPVERYVIESGFVLAEFSTPLKLRYIKRVTDPSKFDATFTEAFYSKLAMDLAEPLTQSDAKFAKAEKQYMRAMSEAVRVSAIEMPPQKLADDEWIMSRL